MIIVGANYHPIWSLASARTLCSVQSWGLDLKSHISWKNYASRQYKRTVFVNCYSPHFRQLFGGCLNPKKNNWYLVIGLSFRHHENRGQEKTLAPKSINIETHSKAALAFIHKRVGVKFMQHCFVMLTWLFLSFCPNVRALKWNQLWSWREISKISDWGYFT